MKKSGIYILLAITLIFAAFVSGFYLGRSSCHGTVQISTQSSQSTAATASSTTPLPTPTQTTAGKVNINTASSEELQTLPGIGPVLAQRIIDYRMTYGYFRSISDLTKVEGIGEKILEELLDLIKV